MFFNGLQESADVNDFLTKFNQILQTIEKLQNLLTVIFKFLQIQIEKNR
jgi:hypothetical protein